MSALAQADPKLVWGSRFVWGLIPYGARQTNGPRAPVERYYHFRSTSTGLRARPGRGFLCGLVFFGPGLSGEGRRTYCVRKLRVVAKPTVEMGKHWEQSRTEYDSSASSETQGFLEGAIVCNRQVRHIRLQYSKFKGSLSLFTVHGRDANHRALPCRQRQRQTHMARLGAGA